MRVTSPEPAVTYHLCELESSLGFVPIHIPGYYYKMSHFLVPSEAKIDESHDEPLIHSCYDSPILARQAVNVFFLPY